MSAIVEERLANQLNTTLATTGLLVDPAEPRPAQGYIALTV